MKIKTIYQFKIELSGIEPSIWRRIEVPSTYSFWDLHVAIQDSMGWLDYHLHTFRLPSTQENQPTLIGTPDEFGGDIVSGAEVGIVEFFTQPGIEANYDYDFGDGWEHKIILEGMFLKQQEVKYPICTGGERASPPEDCGGIPGYYNLVEIVNDPHHEEHEDIVSWLIGHAKNYHPYQAAHFDPTKVKFDNPKKRWKNTFGG